MKTKYKVLSVLASVSATLIGTAVFNKIITINALSKKILETKPSLSFPWRMGNVQYIKTGKGSPLLLLHDFDISSNRYEWNKVINLLAKKHTVYVPDMIGFGLSEKPDMTYTNFLYVQMLCDFVKSEIGKKCTVITSGASSSVLIMANKFSPELFDKMVFISPEDPDKGMLVPGKRSKTYKFIIKLPILGTLLYNIAASKRNIAEKFGSKNFYNPALIDRNFKYICYESMHLGESPKSLYASIVCNYIKCNIKSAISIIDDSVTVINGAEDAEGILSAKKYTALNPSIEKTVLKKSGKFPHLEVPEALVDVLDIYL